MGKSNRSNNKTKQKFSYITTILSRGNKTHVLKTLHAGGWLDTPTLLPTCSVINTAKWLKMTQCVNGMAMCIHHRFPQTHRSVKISLPFTLHGVDFIQNKEYHPFKQHCPKEFSLHLPPPRQKSSPPLYYNMKFHRCKIITVGSVVVAKIAR